MEVVIPEIDKISVKEWLKTDFTIDALLKECGVLLENHVWITARKQKLPVREMSTAHINNCINCLEGNGNMIIPEGYLGGKDKWLNIFKEELESRT